MTFLGRNHGIMGVMPNVTMENLGKTYPGGIRQSTASI